MGLKNLLGISDIADSIADAIDRFVETDEEKKAAKLLKDKMKQNPDRWQLEINKVEAAHRSWFIAGWRPAVAWVCVLSVLWAWVIHPILSSFLSIDPYVNEAPMKLLYTLLGLAGFRTIEKVRGVSK